MAFPLLHPTSEPSPAATAPAAAAPARGAHPDVAASATILAVAVLAVAVAWFQPWWIMKARAPQYGQRTLLVEVGPRDVAGDVREIDMLGHYVGIRPMGGLARIERTLAPLGMLGVIGGLLLAPWLRRRGWRLLMVLPAVLMPLILLVDLKVWMVKTVNDRDPQAALTLTNRINPRLFGSYDVGQFKVATELGSGFYLAAVGGLLGLGLAFAAPLPLPRRHVALVLLGLGAAAGAPDRAPAADVLVGQPHPSIAAAVAAARDGDTVVVPAGTYHEHVVVDRAVRLVGRPGAVIDGDGTGTVLRVAAPGVEVRGLTVRNSGSTYVTEDAGIRIEQVPDVRIVDTRLEEVLFGIFVVHGDRCTIERNAIVGKDLPHVRRGDAIRLWYSGGCRLLANDVARSRDVVIWYSANTTVEDNVVRTSRYGLHYMYSNNNVFHRNRFEDNQVGAAIMYSRGIELTENAFSFSDGSAAYGLLVKDADDVFVVENRFIGNATALFFDNAPQARDGRADVHANLIARNDVGLALQPLSRRIRFWDNAFLGNRMQVQVLGGGSAEANEWAVDGRGNYWGDGLTYDGDGDGISDVPYRAESTYEALADRHAVLGFFDATPAAEAIDLGARLFPIFAPRPKLTDPRPLMAPALTAWTRTEDAGGGRGGLLGAGSLLLAVAVAAGACARMALA